MKSKLRVVRRVAGYGALLVFALSYVGCTATDGRGYDYQAASFRVSLVVNAVDLQFERSSNPAGWTVMSAMPNGLAYWNPVFTSSRVMVPFFHIGAVALLIAIACILPDFLRALREANRRWDNQCVDCGYSLKGNTSGVCPECGRKVRPTDRHPWKPPSLDDRLTS